MTANQTNYKALIALAGTILIWAVSSSFARGFSLAVSPIEALLIRTPISAILFAIVLAFGAGFQMPRQDFIKLVGLSLIGMLGYYLCSIFGFAYAPAGPATLVFSLQPLMIALAASFVGTEKISTLTIVGLIVALAGTALLLFADPNAYAITNASQMTLGLCLMFFASVAWTIYVTFTRPLIQKHGAMKITGLSCIIIAIPLIPFTSGHTIDVLRGLNQQMWFELAFLTMLSSTTSVAMWNYAAGHLRPSLLGSSMYITPLFAILFAWAWLGEPFTPIVMVAGTIILAGLAIAQYKKSVS